MVSVFDIPCLDLKQIAESGQCFRMCRIGQEELPEKADLGYRAVSGQKVLKVWQNGERISFECGDGDIKFWLDYFDAGMDYQKVIDSIPPEDGYLWNAARAGGGIRILKQDPWEMMITFIISQQKTIPKIRELVESLCREYGTRIDRTVWAFPCPGELGRASLEELLALKLGYRAKYIHCLCRDAAAGKLDLTLLGQMEYGEAMEYLTGFYGIGKKVANCVCLFGLHHISAFPVDTWIEKILLEQYYDKQKYRHTPKTCLCDQIVKDCFGQYDGFAGIIQQYIFYYERLRNSRLA